MDAFRLVYPRSFRDALHARAITAHTPQKETLEAIDWRLNSDYPGCVGWRLHLSAWLDFAANRQGLDNDRIRRLQSAGNWQAWNQALNEIRIPYFLGRVYGFDVEFLPTITGHRTPDIRLTKGAVTINVEIKTPGIEGPYLPKRVRHIGKDRKSVKQALVDASKQLPKGQMNLLALGGHLLERNPTVDDTYIIEALYGRDVLAGIVDIRTGSVVGKLFNRFVKDGKMQHNRFTRVSAVLTLEDDSRYSGNRLVLPYPNQYHCVVHHNPHAAIPVDPNLFYGTRQLCFDAQGNGDYRWADGTTYTFRGC